MKITKLSTLLLVISIINGVPLPALSANNKSVSTADDIGMDTWRDLSKFPSDQSFDYSKVELGNQKESIKLKLKYKLPIADPVALLRIIF